MTAVTPHLRLRTIVDELAVAIGERRAGTSQERRAAVYVANAARQFTDRVSIEEFSFRNWASSVYDVDVQLSADASPLVARLLPTRCLETPSPSAERFRTTDDGR